MSGDRDWTGGREEPEGCGFLEPGEIEALLEGTLAAERRARFEAHLLGGCAACALLAADAEVFAGALGGEPSAEERAGAEADRKAVREALWRQRREARRSRRTRGWALAGLAAAAVLVAVLVLFLPVETSPEVLLVELRGGESYEAALMEFSAPPIVRGAPDESPAWESAERAYRAGDFAAAATTLRPLAERTGDSSAYLYLGVALLATGESQGALEALDKGREITANEDLPDGALRWHQGLALLSLGRDLEARRALEELAASDLAFAGKARELLDLVSSPSTDGP